jgi:hypothetical protein
MRIQYLERDDISQLETIEGLEMLLGFQVVSIVQEQTGFTEQYTQTEQQ